MSYDGIHILLDHLAEVSELCWRSLIYPHPALQSNDECQMTGDPDFTEATLKDEGSSSMQVDRYTFNWPLPVAC